MESVWSVSILSTKSVGSRHELAASSVHTADATQLDSCIASAVCIGHYYQNVTTHTCRKKSGMQAVREHTDK